MFHEVANRIAQRHCSRPLKRRREGADTRSMSRAEKIGKKLKRRMERKRLDVADLARKAGKDARHVQAILDGYPNTTTGRTQLDTVDAIAAELGLKLDLTRRK